MRRVGDGAERVRLPAIGAAARARLWLSYQRYAFLLAGLPIAAVAAAAAVAPRWLAVVVAIAGLAPLGFAIEVLRRWPRKLRATQVAHARIAGGRFAPSSVRGYCGDPCFRVVAHEILAHAGIARATRRALVRDYAAQLRRDSEQVLLVDHVRGTVTVLGGDPRERT